MASWIDRPLGLGNDDGEISTMYGIPIRPVLSPTPTDSDIREKQKDRGLIASAMRLLKVRQVRFVILGTGKPSPIAKFLFSYYRLFFYCSIRCRDIDTQEERGHRVWKRPR